MGLKRRVDEKYHNNKWPDMSYMIEQLAHDDPFHKLLISASIALPVQGNPIDKLSEAFRISPEEIEGRFSDLMENDEILGVWGEPNVHLTEFQEGLAYIDSFKLSEQSDGSFVRWVAKKEDKYLASLAKLGSRPECFSVGGRFFKVGVNYLTTHPLETFNERTFLVSDQDQQDMSELDPSLIPLFQKLTLPQKVTYKNFWRDLSNGLNLSDEACRKGISQILVSKVCRRFALRLSLNSFKGSGLVGWKIENPGDLPKAAQALSRVACSGDVCLRMPTKELDCNLTSLILSRRAGEGREVVKEIADQWGVNPSTWWDLELL